VLGISSHIVPGDFARAFGSSQSTDAKEFAKIAVALTIGRPDDQGRTVDGMEFTADNKRERMVLGGRMGPDDSRKSVPVGNRKSLVAIELGLLDKLMGMRGSFEEREVRFAVEFDVGRHA
jgi:hypothetical protein